MRVLVVDDSELVRSNIAELLRGEGWDVTEADSAHRAFELMDDVKWPLVFCDVKLSEKSDNEGYDVLRRFNAEQPEARIVLMTGHASAVGALDAVSAGAYDYLTKPFENDDVLRIAQAVRRGIEKKLRPGTTGERPIPPVYTSDINLVGVSPAFVEVMKLVGRVAATPLPVLITGESGTGKEVVARAIHQRSPRARAPFVAVNCGAVPAELIESELFGHVRGAFTGADRDRMGLFQEADGGTVFLDEITETTPAFQVKLLRVLQEGEVRRVGSNHTQKIDVRVIAASNVEVEREMREARFRHDLFYRLNAVTIYLPPLRERREDIMPLARFFAARTARYRTGPVSFSSDAVRLLEAYEWPGNIRELENAVMRAAALCDQAIRPEDLPERVRHTGTPPSMTTETTTGRETDDGILLTLSEVERRHVARVLSSTGGNKQAAARVLGVDRTTLQRMIKRHGIESSRGAAAAQGAGEAAGRDD